MTMVNVVGGGLAGLVAAITAAEAGAGVELTEARTELGGRARTSAPPYLANEGPHVVYGDGPIWPWLKARGLDGGAPGIPLRSATGYRFRVGGRLRLSPPPGPMLRLLTGVRLTAPVDRDFRSWTTERFGAAASELAVGLLGVVTFDADPGRLSAAFAWERLTRLLTTIPPAPRYIPGGWGTMIDRLAGHARALGVTIRTGVRVTELPAAPVVVATSLPAAATLLGDPGLRWESGATAMCDLGLTGRRGDPFLVWDLDERGWIERYTLPDPTLAPAGEALIQAQLPIRPGESTAAVTGRLERFLDTGVPGWRDRVRWRRDAVARGRSGALDLPGTSWRDRPAIDRGDGVFLAGDQVAAPGLLGEVSFTSAVQAASLAAGRVLPALTG
jgi:phytoene dehydrogenase-like protein